ncbi:metallophosphoesterase [Thermococcus chitonophagus]|uniref:FIG006285: ICC-like protein phosphoesterase n=1 Tax=Thermococcus chitonophagus TaxID=54262 RepID=A0A170SWJ7_9EURY|nr:metallophosphoesterase [Thermococcus chitonophagus]ASJ16251.1 metallophosphoesterase [Thermococcus chitonophagus]CUX78767.1 FIG006285: ICC-like protein phosphoesterase [Thermococcus chitonophagus]
MQPRIIPEKGVILGDYLIIADLHIGFEEALVKGGKYVPRLLGEVINQVISMGERYRVDKLIINGDLKHSFIPERREFIEISTFLESILKEFSEIIVVKGNHDTGINWIRKFGVEVVESVEVMGWTIVHGHKECDCERVIIGHEHPAIRLRDEVGATVKVPAFLRRENIVVLPAFSPWAYGNDLTLNEPISPILKNADITQLEVLIPVESEVLSFGKFGELIEALKGLSPL